MTLSKSTRIHSTLFATAALVTVGAAPQLTAPVRAQALQPVVDVCTGISLEPSAVTDIVGDVAVPTADAVEGLYDALLSENDHDLYQWVTGHTAPPPRFSDLIDRIARVSTPAG